ncbi:PIN-like domain-containing protein [Rossellomorea sp. DUT-2]|uniref:PIN-like domain-containing protein n=1 Tax=Rossellomorea sp. DUT-2 TaxID=3412021 RepID=UPI003D18357A
MKDKISKQFDILKGFKFPNIEKLEGEIEEHITEVENAFKDYASELDTLKELNNRFLDNDKIKRLIDSLVNKNNLLQAFSLDEIYLLCAEGEKRYKKNTPPGYKDGKDKSGIQAYGDLLIWREAMNYCRDKKLNLIFVTDDVKEDWYELNNSERVGFRQELINEFKMQTSKDLLGVTSNELFAALADINNMEIPTTVEWVLGYDVDNYIENIMGWGITGDIIGALINSTDRFVDTSTLTNYDGSEFEIQDELLNSELISYEFEGYYDGVAEYNLKLKIKVQAISQQYWGRDHDTKDIILSDSTTHILEGELGVKVTRRIESYLEEFINDHSYGIVEIISGQLVEVYSYTEDELCIECGNEIGKYFDMNDHPICEGCMVTNSKGEICPNCGKKVAFEFMGGQGFCKNCEDQYDL